MKSLSLRAARRAVAALGGRDGLARARAAEALDHRTDRRAVPALRAALRHPSPTVRRHALHAVACDRCKTRPLPLDVTRVLCRAAADDPSPRVRRVALHLLALRPRSARARAVLQAALRRERNPRARFIARWGLARHGASPARPRETRRLARDEAPPGA
jgi:hypothetical protein